jgi:peptidase E
LLKIECCYNLKKKIKMPNKNIIVLGDGGTDGKNPLNDLYILAQSQKKNPKICFLGTAGGDDLNYTKYFHQLFGQYPCETSDLSVFRPETADIKDFLLTKDIIYVGGGHTKSMLILWAGYGIDLILKEAYDGGITLSGGSAGLVYPARECVTDSIPGQLTVMPCLNILPFSLCPHYASSERRKVYTSFVKEGKISGGYSADDHAALHFVDGQHFRSVSSKPYAKTYKVSLENNKVLQKRLKTDWLGMEKYQQEYIFNSTTFQQ